MLDKFFIKTLNNTRSIPSIALSLALIIFILRILFDFYIEGTFELSMFIFLGSIGLEKYLEKKYSDYLVKPPRFSGFDQIIEKLPGGLILLFIIAFNYRLYQDRIELDPSYSFWDNFFYTNPISILWMLVLCYLLFKYRGKS